MSRNAYENRRNGNDFHSGHRKQNRNLQTQQVPICQHSRIHLNNDFTTFLFINHYFLE